MATELSSLEVERADNDGGGRFALYVDGKRLDRLASGDSVSLLLKPGVHHFQLRFAWISSVTVELSCEGGEIFHFVARRRWGSGPFNSRYLTQRHSAIVVESLLGA